MSSILHDFEVNAEPSKVYETITTPEGLDQWWTRRARGEPRVGEEYELWFGPEYDWRAKVTEAVPSRRFALEITGSDEDWMGTSVAFALEPARSGTRVRFSHTGWRSENEHFRVSSYCWAMYLRLMRRFTEAGEVVPYVDRINV
jgi:uncharacterized protein YndB with AHSA1/START domain